MPFHPFISRPTPHQTPNDDKYDDIYNFIILFYNVTLFSKITVFFVFIGVSPKKFRTLKDKTAEIPIHGNIGQLFFHIIGVDDHLFVL